MRKLVLLMVLLASLAFMATSAAAGEDQCEGDDSPLTLIIT